MVVNILQSTVSVYPGVPLFAGDDTVHRSCDDPEINGVRTSRVLHCIMT